MGWLKVVGPVSGTQPLAAPTFPADGQGNTAYSERYSLGGPPPTPPAAPSGLIAATASSSQIDLAWSDNSDNESNFEVERSPVGAGSFTNIATVGIDVTGYSDSGLSPETTYDYRVYAINGAGSSGYTNVASATTDPVTAGSTMKVGSLIVTAEGVGKGFKAGRADVVVLDDQDNPVTGAVVTGDFSGTFNETATSQPTDAAGATTLGTVGTAKGQVSVTFCVTSITDHPALPDYTGTAADCASN